MRVEQDQKVTEDARRFAEQDAAAQRYAATVLQVNVSPMCVYANTCSSDRQMDLSWICTD